MSDVSTASRPARNHDKAHDAKSPAPAAAPAAPAAVAPAAVDKGTSTFELTGLEVTVPNKFAAGDTLDATLASILMTAFVRQFTNNMNANIKARAERFAKATTDAERAANAPYTAAEIVALFADYVPSVGGGPRLGNAEKLRLEAAWRAWSGMVAEHNKAAAAGGAPVILRAAKDGVAVPVDAGMFRAPPKGKNQSDADHKAAVEANAEAKTAFLQKMLASPAYAERIQIALDAILAERGSKATPKTEAVKIAASDLL